MNAGRKNAITYVTTVTITWNTMTRTIGRFARVVRMPARIWTNMFVDGTRWTVGSRNVSVSPRAAAPGMPYSRSVSRKSPVRWTTSPPATDAIAVARYERSVARLITAG